MTKIIKFDTGLTHEGWEKYIPEDQYRIVDITELPEKIAKNGLTAKFNKIMLCCSGSTEAVYYCVLGARLDENNTVVDKDAFVFGYNRKTGYEESVQMLHGSYSDRTTKLSPDMINIIKASGSNFHPLDVIGIPTVPSGSIQTLMSDSKNYDASKHYFENMVKRVEK